MYTTIERRKYHRASKPYIVRLRVKSNECNEMVLDDWNTITIQNLSVDSIFFYYEKNLAIGALLDLKINIPKPTTTINCKGKVVRTKKHLNSFMSGIAAVLVDMGDKERDVVVRSIQEDSKQENQFIFAS